MANQQELKEIKEATVPLEREMAQAQLGTHPKYKGPSAQDDLLRDRAKAGRTVAERRAAMNTAASLGRDDLLRDLQADPSVNQEHLRAAISQSAGPLLLKAPDLVKGQDAAFGSVTGQQISTWSKGTAEAHMKYMEDQHAQANDASLSVAERAAAQDRLDAAARSFNTSVEDVTKNPQLQSTFSGDTGLKIHSQLGKSSATFQAYAAANLHGLAAIDTTDGKIR
jgi:hypothetical protein